MILPELGEEWKKLAHYLSVRRIRIQAIMRNNVNKDNESAIYDMLLTWAKKVPRSVNKVKLYLGTHDKGFCTQKIYVFCHFHSHKYQ